MSAGLPLVGAVATIGAVLLARPGPPPYDAGREGARGVGPPSSDAHLSTSEAGWLGRYRLVWSLLGGLGAWAFVGGSAGLVAGLVASVAVGVLATRAEPPARRREREAVRRDLPHLVSLLSAALRSGVAPGQAVVLVGAALPGAASARLAPVAARLRLGGDVEAAWAHLAADAELAPLGRALARAHRSGAPVVAAVERLADELARSARADVEDRARAVGVRAAVPLGLCLLPAFVLIGIVPVVGALLRTLAW